MRIERIIETFDVALQITQFPLHPDTPREGRSLTDLFSGRAVDLEAYQARVVEIAAEEGLPYGLRTHTYNSRLAQELGTWADTQPGGAAYHDALYKAYFVEARNIGDPEVLVEIAGSVGLSAEAAQDVLQERRFQAAVDADWTKSRDYGVTGVPTFVSSGYGVVGAQPYEALAQLLERVGAPARS